MNRSVILFLCVILLSGCTKEATETTQNGNFTVDFLFEQDGCRMYRFSDSGRYIYWTNCQGKVNSDYSTQAGKSRVTHRVEAITTE